MVFNRFSKFEWKLLFEKLSFHSVPIYQIYWAEIVIQAYYRDEHISEDEWPSEDEDLVLDLFDDDIVYKPRKMFEIMYEGLLLSIGSLKNLMPNSIDWFTLEINDWKDTEYLMGRIDDFFFDLCNHVVYLKISSLLSYTDDNKLCTITSNFSDFTGFFRLCGYLYFNCYEYFNDKISSSQHYNLFMNVNSTVTGKVMKCLYLTYKDPIDNITVKYKNRFYPFLYTDFCKGSELLRIKMFKTKVYVRKLQRKLRKNFKYYALKSVIKRGKLPIDLYKHIFKFI